MRVLIVEDEYLIATEVSDALEKAGFEIAGTVSSVSKALRKIDEAGCDLAVLDANLQGFSAEPVAEALRQRGIPFLVLSGYSSLQRQGVLAEAPFLAKPCRPAQVVAAVLALAKELPISG